MHSLNSKKSAAEIRAAASQPLIVRGANAQPVLPVTQPHRFLTIRETCQRVSMSRSSVYAYMQANKFPKNYKVGDKAMRFLESEVNEWIEQRLQK